MAKSAMIFLMSDFGNNNNNNDNNNNKYCCGARGVKLHATKIVVLCTRHYANSNVAFTLLKLIVLCHENWGTFYLKSLPN